MRFKSYCFGLPFEAVVTMFYIFVAAVWLFFADRVLALLRLPPKTREVLATYEGWLYLVFTVVLLFGILRRIFIGITRAHERYHRVFFTAGDAMFLQDQSTGSILDSNEAACTMYGYDHAEFNKLKNTDLSVESEKIGKAIKQKLSGAPVHYHIKKDGTVFPVEITSSHYDQGGQRVRVVNIRDITERMRSEGLLRHESKRISLLLELYEQAQSMSDQELYNFMVEHAVALTESEIGFLHLVSADQKTIAMTTWDSGTLKTCTAVYEDHYPLEEAGNWVDCVRSRKTIVYNDFPNSPNQKGLPEGHVPLKRFMSIPVLEDDQIQIVFGVGNKVAEYTEYDVVQIRLVVNELYKIIKHRNLDAALREREASLSEAQRIAHVGSWIFDIATNTLDWSDEIYHIFGLDPEALSPSYDVFLDVIHPDDRERVHTVLDESLKNKIPYEVVYRLLLKDGAIKYVCARCKTDYADDGTPLRSIGTVQDVTDLRIAEDCIREAKQHLQYIIDNTKDVIFQIDLKGNYIYVNQATEKMTGYSSTEFLQMNMMDLIAPEYHAQRAERLKETIDGHVDENMYTLEIIRKDGHRLWVELSSDPVVNDAGELVAVQGVARNINKRKQAEQERLRLSIAIDQATEAVIITDIEGTIEYVNPAFSVSSGYTKEEAVGRNPRMLKSGQQDDATYKEMWEQISSGQPWKGNLQNKHKDGSIYIEEATISSVHNTSGTIVNYVAVKRDITKELDIEEQFRQSQKMEAVGRLAGGVAHDFNNILQSIIGFCGLLLVETEGQDSLQKDVIEIQNAAQRAGVLTHQLLDFSRKRPVDFSPVDLNEIIANEKKMLGLLLDKKMSLVFEPAADLTPVIADAGQMEQVVMNLVVNARDAMPDAGKITIRTDNVVFSESVARMPKSRPGTFVCLSVTDVGIGIEKEVFERLFEPFFTTKKVGEGTGLGLAIVYGVIEQHKGWLEVESEVGQGSTFKVYLPTSTDVEVEEDVTGNEGRVLSDAYGDGKQILLVEDDPEVRKLITHILQDAGYRITGVESAAQATVAFHQVEGRFDLLFSNMILPDQTGIELATSLHEKKSGLPVLLFSDYSDEYTRSNVVENKGYLYMKKPFNIAKLLSNIYAATKV